MTTSRWIILFGCGAVVLSCALCFVCSSALAIAGVLAGATGTPDATASLIALSATTAPSNTPTRTLAPSETAMPSNTPRPSNTPHPTFTAAPSAFESQILALEGVKAVRAADARDLGDGSWIVYLEVDVLPGENNGVMAGMLRQASYSFTRSARVEFSAIIWDGESAAVDWTWDNRSDSWQQTPLSITPAPLD